MSSQLGAIIDGAVHEALEGVLDMARSDGFVAADVTLTSAWTDGRIHVAIDVVEHKEMPTEPAPPNAVRITRIDA